MALQQAVIQHPTADPLPVPSHQHASGTRAAAASFKLPLMPCQMFLSDIFTSGRDAFETHLSFAQAEKCISCLGFDF